MKRNPTISRFPTRTETNREANLIVDRCPPTDTSEILREYYAMTLQIERGDPMHPQEVQDMVDALIEASYYFQADKLADMKVNWDRG
ncbi:hypothetical protein NUH86_11070 [Sphingobium sp. JS3065]|uniref:hypothetical protein n=1 Tax=Sphingobium sp. JS3065 TaxID=2970925 RepID=UPI002264DCE8|nr:hypothetical protein [Sphingobium sp. JS3065]UZW54076.1 hypothetical protein NUH86_11070 [Sphingobium sp. JS3065]